MTPGLLTCHQVYSHDTRSIRMLTGLLTRHQVHSHDTRSTHMAVLMPHHCWTTSRPTPTIRARRTCGVLTIWTSKWQPSGQGHNTHFLSNRISTNCYANRTLRATGTMTRKLLFAKQTLTTAHKMKCGDSIVISISTFKPVSFASMNK